MSNADGSYKRDRAAVGSGKNRLFISVAVSYCVLLFAMCGVCFIGYAGLDKASSAEARNANRALLAQVKSVVDDKIRSIDREILGLILEPSAQDFAFAKAPVTPGQVYEASLIIQSMGERVSRNGSMKDFLIYYPLADKVISAAGMYTADAYYAHHVAGQSISFEQWERALTGAGTLSYLPNVFLGGGSSISILCPFPLKPPMPERQAVLCVLVDLNAIDALVGGVVIGRNSIIITDDQTGDVIYAPPGFDPARFIGQASDELERAGYLIDTSRSGYKPWTYYAVCDKSGDLFHEFTSASRFMGAAIIVMALIGILIAVISARSQYKPIKTIITKNEEYQLANERYRERVKRLSEEIRDRVLRDILEGMLSKDELGLLLAESDIALPDGRARVMLLRVLDGSDNPDGSRGDRRINMRGALKECVADCCSINLDYNTTALILPETDGDDIRRRAVEVYERLVKRLAENGGAVLLSSCGVMVQSAGELAKSYASARKTLDTLGDSDARRLAFSEDAPEPREWACSSPDYDRRISSRRSSVPLERARAYIDERYADTGLCTETVAQFMGISPNYLSSEFRKRYNDGVAEYINRRRVEVSKRLLIEDKDSVSEVAARIGYTNLMTYLRNFRKMENMTPTQYKELHTEDIHDKFGNI